MTDKQDTYKEESYVQYKETEYERKLREYATLPDPKRPKEDHYLEYFYNTMYRRSTPDQSVLPHSDVFYVREALEAKFPDRIFTIKEVKALIKEIYNKSY